MVPVFRTVGVFEGDIPYRRSVAVTVRCMLYQIRRNPMHPRYGARPVPYVLARVTLGALVSHRNTYGPPHCRTSQYHRTFLPISVSLWTFISRRCLADPVCNDVRLAGFMRWANTFHWPKLLASSTVFSLATVFPLSSFFI